MPETRRISIKYALPLIGLGVGVLSWVLHSALDALVLGQGSLIQRLLPSDPHEIVMRLLVVGVILGFAFLARTLLSEREFSREAARFREQRTLSLIETMAEGMIVIDPDGCIMQANAAAELILGRPTGRTDSNWTFLRPDGTRMPNDQTAVGQARRGSRAVTGVLMGVERPDGKVAWIDANATPISGEDGEEGWVVSTFTDISRHKRTQDELSAERAALERRVEERTREIERKSRELALTRERERLARELHDSVTQTLFSAGLIADALPRLWERDAEAARNGLEQLRGLTRDALIQMRSLLFELRPTAIVGAELGSLLRQLGDSFAGRDGLRIDVEVRGQGDTTPELKTAFYRIAGEALANVSNHAGAGHARILLRYDADGIEVSVIDDGRGFDLEEITAGRLGLRIMRERAEAAGIGLQIDSRPGQGTRVTARWHPHGTPRSADSREPAEPVCV